MIAVALLAPAAALAEEPAPAVAVDRQELGAAIGFALGGRTTPGGFVIDGTYLYQVTDSLWFDGSMAFVYGGGDAECFRDRADVLLCDHDLVDGFGGGVVGGLRWFLADREGWVPYVRGGVGVEVASFPQDDLRGVVIPLVVGGGLRTRVADGVAIGGAASLRVGGGWFARDLGGEPSVAMVVQVGVEFGLD